MTVLPGFKAAPIVGRPALLDQAAADFLSEVARQQPWKRSRSEELLESLDGFLGSPALLASYTPQAAAAWRQTLPPTEQEAAGRLLTDFDLYLQEWGWRTATGEQTPGR